MKKAVHPWLWHEVNEQKEERWLQASGRCDPTPAVFAFHPSLSIPLNAAVR